MHRHFTERRVNANVEWFFMIGHCHGNSALFDVALTGRSAKHRCVKFPFVEQLHLDGSHTVWGRLISGRCGGSALVVSWGQCKPHAHTCDFCRIIKAGLWQKVGISGVTRLLQLVVGPTKPSTCNSSVSVSTDLNAILETNVFRGRWGRTPWTLERPILTGPSPLWPLLDPPMSPSCGWPLAPPPLTPRPIRMDGTAHPAAPLPRPARSGYDS